MVSITSEPIDVQAIVASVLAPPVGGIDVFIGTVRDHSGGKRVRQLEYTAYVPMAERIMADIEREIRARWPVYNVAMVHRIGLLSVGDTAVLTAVSTAHRKDAFEACRHAIDRIKNIVPIWKKEFFEEGAVWVVGQHDVHIER